MKESFHPEPHNFDSDVARHATDQADLNISDERVKIETETKLATRLVNRFQAPADLKQELIDFIVDFYDITEENALDTVKQASHELYTGMRSFLKDQGLLFTPNGKVDTMFKANQEALTNPETAAGLEKYLQLVDLDVQIQAQKPFVYKKNFPLEEIVVDKNENWKNESLSYNDAFRENVFDTMLGEENVRTNPDVDHPGIKNPVDIKSILKPKPEAKQEEEHGKIIYQALEKYKFSAEIEDIFVADALQKIAAKQETVTEENVADILLSVADKLKLEITLGLLKHDFSLDHYGKLTLPENKKSILRDERIAWNLKLLEATNKIISPADNLKTLTILPAEAVHNTTERTKEVVQPKDYSNHEQALQDMGLSNDSIDITYDALFLQALGGAEIADRGPRGLEQIADKVIAQLEKENGFKLNKNREIILLSLADKINIFNKSKKIEAAANSPAYKKMVALHILKEELQYAKPLVVKQHAQPTVGKFAVGVPVGMIAAGLGAGALATEKIEQPDEHMETAALRMPAVIQANETQQSKAMADLGIKIAPQMEEDESSSSVRRSADFNYDQAEPTVQVAAPIESQVTATSTTEVDTRFKSTNFRKPTSLNRKSAPMKIDAFNYQDPTSLKQKNSLPKLTRPNLSPTAAPTNTSKEDTRFAASREKMNQDILNTVKARGVEPAPGIKSLRPERIKPVVQEVKIDEEEMGDMVGVEPEVRVPKAGLATAKPEQKIQSAPTNTSKEDTRFAASREKMNQDILNTVNNKRLEPVPVLKKLRADKPQPKIQSVQAQDKRFEATRNKMAEDILKTANSRRLEPVPVLKPLKKNKPSK